MASAFANGIIFGGADTVRIAASDQALFITDSARSSHSGSYAIMAVPPMQDFVLIFSLIVLIMSVVIHEVSHGLVANVLGDPTARLSGRLTLNPLAHLDPFGSVILPLLLFLSGGFVFGWAKPVPYNPYNLRGGKWGPALVALAGPASNLLVAVVFSVLLHLSFFSPKIIDLFISIISLNIVLAVFNSIPLPPFDGFKVISPLLPYPWYQKAASFEASFGLYLIPVVIIFFVLFLQGPVSIVVNFIARLLIGF